MQNLIDPAQLASIALVSGAAVLAVTAFYGFKYGAALLKVKLGDSQFALLEGYTRMVVRWLEQSGIKLNYTSEEKKAIAVVAITEFAKKLNIPIDADLVDKLVEAAVNIMNGDLLVEEPKG